MEMKYILTTLFMGLHMTSWEKVDNDHVAILQVFTIAAGQAKQEEVALEKCPAYEAVGEDVWKVDVAIYETVALF